MARARTRPETNPNYIKYQKLNDQRDLRKIRLMMRSRRHRLTVGVLTLACTQTVEAGQDQVQKRWFGFGIPGRLCTVGRQDLGRCHGTVRYQQLRATIDKPPRNARIRPSNYWPHSHIMDDVEEEEASAASQPIGVPSSQPSSSP